MPMEYERQYIENIRRRFPNIPNSELALMFGMSTASLSKTFKAIGIKTAQKHGENLFLKDAEKYNEWLFWSGTGAKHVSQPTDEPEEMPPAESETVLEEMDEYDEPVCEVPGFEDATPSAPCSGEIVWNGNARQIFDALAPIIGTENVKLKISWEVCA